MPATPLSRKLRALATRYDAPYSERLLQLAQDFDEKSAEYAQHHSATTAKRLFGSWARARRAYCDITGERLV